MRVYTMDENNFGYKDLINILKECNIIKDDNLTKEELFLVIQKFSEHIGIIQDKL